MESLEDRRLLAAMASEGYRDSSLMVKFRDGAAARAEVLGSTLGMEWAVAPGVRQVNLAPGYDVAEAMRVYRSDPNVEFAEPDYRVSLLAEPNDPQYFHQWDLTNAGTNGGIEDADIDAPEAWDVTTGSDDVVVAVIDTGVDYNHPDLAANIWTNPGEIPGNRKDDDGNGFVDDVHGYDFANNDGDPMDDHFHGTHVAGTIGAVGDNDIGVVGVNWHVKIMALKFLDGSGSGYASDAIDALNYAVANGATVSNNSWGGGGESQAMKTAIQNAAAKGHIYVAAAGNDGSNNDVFPFFPANYNVGNVISVAASNIDDELAYFSNFGKKTVDLAAPGQDIYSTMPSKATPAMKQEGLPAGYGTLSGTSMAAPHVTGVVALVRSLHPDWTYKQVIDQIMNTVDVIDAFSQTISGGRLNAAGAVGNPAPPPPDSKSPKIIASDPEGGVPGPVSSIHVRFSESIDLATIGYDDVVSFDGPDGPLSLTSLFPVEGSNEREFEFTFDEQASPGIYSFVLGANISDLSGNLVDQNGDGLGGQDPSDRYSVTFTIGGTVTPPPPNDLPLPIGDELGVPVESYLTVDQDVSITDLNVQLNISYPYVGDLYVTIRSPSGTEVTLTAFNGGMDADFADTIFDDEADLPINYGFGPYSGSYQPDGTNGYLSAFDGENAHGVWTLSITVYPFFGFLDGYGQLNTWSLQIEGDGGGTPPDDPPDTPPDDPPPSENHAPVAVQDSYAGVVNTPLTVKAADLLANDFDPDGDKLSISFVGNPTGGSVSLSSGGTIIFTPDFGLSGVAGFQYVVSDGSLVAIGDVTLDIAATFQNHNTHNGMDVNNDGVVTPLDALLIINFLNSPKPSNPDFVIAAGSGYYDVVPDNVVAPLDALAVINYLNSGLNKSSQPAAVTTAAEGESFGALSAAACDSTAGSDSQLAASASEPRRRLRAAVDHLMASDALQKLLDELNLSCGGSGS